MDQKLQKIYYNGGERPEADDSFLKKKLKIQMAKTFIEKRTKMAERNKKDRDERKYRENREALSFSFESSLFFVYALNLVCREEEREM